MAGEFSPCLQHQSTVTTDIGSLQLLHLMGGLDRPTSGKVVLQGNAIESLSDNELSLFRRLKLGFIFQFSNLLADLTVLENVMLPRSIQRTDQNAQKEAIDLLYAVGLDKQMNKRANKVSGGQAQRAAIARGLVNHPTIVLADEPTGNLDSVTAETIVQLMKSMAKKLNQTFVIVTHDRHQFGEVDRVITIKDGRAFEGEDVPPKMEITI